MQRFQLLLTPPPATRAYVQTKFMKPLKYLHFPTCSTRTTSSFAGDLFSLGALEGTGELAHARVDESGHDRGEGADGLSDLRGALNHAINNVLSKRQVLNYRA